MLIGVLINNYPSLAAFDDELRVLYESYVIMYSRVQYAICEKTKLQNNCYSFCRILWVSGNVMDVKCHRIFVYSDFFVHSTVSVKAGLKRKMFSNRLYKYIIINILL